MKTFMQPTSLEAYDHLIMSETLGLKQIIILKAFLKYGDMTNLGVSRALNIPINCVTPRVKELRDMKLLERKGVKIETTGHRGIIWGICL